MKCKSLKKNVKHLVIYHLIEQMKKYVKFQTYYKDAFIGKVAIQQGLRTTWSVN